MEDRPEHKRGSTREIFGMLELFDILSEITRIYRCVKRHTLYTPKVTFTLRKLNHRVVIISHASKVMLKILQARLQQYVNKEIPNVQAGFRKGRGTRYQTAKSVRLKKRQGNLGKTFTASLTRLKPLTMWITTNCEKFLERWEYQTTLPAS